MVQDWDIKSLVEFATMNRSYLSYFKTRNPFKFISSIFRNYKKSSDSIKRNQSEPAVTKNPCNGDLETNKPKSEINLCSSHNDKHIKQWSNSKFDDNASQESLKATSSSSIVNKVPSNISLKKTSCHLDLNIQEKLNHIPLQPVEVKKSYSYTKVPLKRAYPWQNFNLTTVRKPRYEEIKEVSDMRDEIIKFRKSILRKPELKPFHDRDRENPIKEVKFNKLASLMVYPKNNYNVMKQARINLSTNVTNAEKCPMALYRKKKQPILNINKVNNVKTCCQNNYKKNMKKLRKCFPVEHGNFWYLSNAKKQKIF